MTQQTMKTRSYPELLRYYPEKRDILQFTKHLGYNNAPFHTEWYNFLQNQFSPMKLHPDAQKKYLLLWPRGHGKTTTINLYILWLIGKYPNIHINIVTKTSSLAEEILTALMTNIEEKQQYINIFGKLKPQHPRKWTSRELIVQRSEISKNPTIKATGLMGPITGGRSDLVVCDDIIDEENIRTRLQTEKVSTWFNKVLIPTLYPWGGIIVIGTRWSYADIYAELLERWPNDIKQAIQKDGSALWPTYWSLERLKERRDEIGTIFFNCQYQNDPTGMEGDLLKAQWLRPWKEPPNTRYLTYAGVDPSLGEGDLFGIATLAHDGHRKGYLKEVYAEKGFNEGLAKLNYNHSIHHYAKIYVESNALQKLLLKLPELEGLPTVPTQTVRDKQSRFITMSSHFESERIEINPLLLNRGEFWMEWVQFPRGQYDDALDAVEIVTRNTVGGRRGFFA